MREGKNFKKLQQPRNWLVSATTTVLDRYVPELLG